MKVHKDVHYLIEDAEGNSVLEIRFSPEMGEMVFDNPENGYNAFCGNYHKIAFVENLISELSKIVKECKKC